jgi:cytochrome c oxidase cbb3-type subunit 1
MEPYNLWRGVGGVLMFLSHVVFGWNVWRMTLGKSGSAESPIMDSSEIEAAA